jgi:hypothetical protein
MLNKTIWLLWLQGWENAPWLQKQVAESWEINNPDWKIEYVSFDNLKNYITDIEYIYDKKKRITPQALSDIIRLSLLKNHGGVWADSTMLCMQPLNNWVFDAVSNSKFWMYHGHGGGMNPKVGPASWFIISEKESTIISKWKLKCDNYWLNNNSTRNYFWMDGLFRELYENDTEFAQLWNSVPYIYCEEKGQSHTLAHYGMEKCNEDLKQIFKINPPYALKFWKSWNNLFPDISVEKCQKSNGFYAIQMSKRLTIERV